MKYLKTIMAVCLLSIALLPACNKKEQPEQAYKVDDITIEQLRACAKLITVIPIDSCEYIVSPIIGVNQGLNIVHKENCKNHK